MISRKNNPVIIRSSIMSLLPEGEFLLRTAICCGAVETIFVAA
jgi:hypothetical protein